MNCLRISPGTSRKPGAILRKCSAQAARSICAGSLYCTIAVIIGVPPLFVLNGHPATVDDDHLAGDEGAGRRGEQQRGASDVLGLAQAPQWRVRFDPGAALRVFVEGAGEFGLDQTRRDAVDPDAVGPPLGGEAAAQRVV